MCRMLFHVLYVILEVNIICEKDRFGGHYLSSFTSYVISLA